MNKREEATMNLQTGWTRVGMVTVLLLWLLARRLLLELLTTTLLLAAALLTFTRATTIKHL